MEKSTEGDEKEGEKEREAKVRKEGIEERNKQIKESERIEKDKTKEKETHGCQPSTRTRRRQLNE